jgi:predicted ATPase with chaperone activity
MSDCVQPCACGYDDDSQKPCTCAHALVTKIKNEFQVPCWIASIRRSRIEVPLVEYEKLRGDRVGEPSECIRVRVQAARNIQQARFTNPEYRASNNGSSTDIVCNADMRVAELRQFCELQDEGAVLSLSKHQSLTRVWSQRASSIPAIEHKVKVLTVSTAPACTGKVLPFPMSRS